MCYPIEFHLVVQFPSKRKPFFYQLIWKKLSIVLVASSLGLVISFLSIMMSFYMLVCPFKTFVQNLKLLIMSGWWYSRMIFEPIISLMYNCFFFIFSLFLVSVFILKAFTSRSESLLHMPGHRLLHRDFKLVMQSCSQSVHNFLVTFQLLIIGLYTNILHNLVYLSALFAAVVANYILVLK